MEKSLYTVEQLNSIITNEQLNNRKIVLFSEDIPWCKEHINKDYQKNIFFIEGNKPFEDIYAMTLCNKIIPCNSSFNATAIRLKNAIDNINKK